MHAGPRGHRNAHPPQLCPPSLTLASHPHPGHLPCPEPLSHLQLLLMPQRWPELRDDHPVSLCASVSPICQVEDHHFGQCTPVQHLTWETAVIAMLLEEPTLTSVPHGSSSSWRPCLSHTFVTTQLQSCPSAPTCHPTSRSPLTLQPEQAVEPWWIPLPFCLPELTSS